METVTIKVFGMPPDFEPSDCHDTTYLEWEIPKELEQKLGKLIEKEIDKFQRKCSCESCQQYRKENPTMTEMAKLSGLNYGTIYTRIKELGWDRELAISTPLTTPRSYKKILKKNGNSIGRP
jgi:hypothetical protein